jgi:hypothetical protein
MHLHHSTRVDLPLTITNRTRCEDRLLPLPQTRINPLIDQLLCQTPPVCLARDPLRNQLLPRVFQTLAIILGVVDVADLLPIDGLVDRAEVSRAQEAGLEEFCGGREVARVLLVTEVTLLDEGGFLRAGFLGGGLGCWARGGDCRGRGAGGVYDDGGRAGGGGGHFAKDGCGGPEEREERWYGGEFRRSDEGLRSNRAGGCLGVVAVICIDVVWSGFTRGWKALEVGGWRNKK